MQIVHYGNLSASTVLIQPVGDHDLEEMETELNEIRKQGKADFQLIAVKVDNWNQDLSPWEASAVFGREGFGDGAGELLQFLLVNVRIAEKRIISVDIRWRDYSLFGRHIRRISLQVLQQYLRLSGFRDFCNI